jgi:hypothetical protein
MVYMVIGMSKQWHSNHVYQRVNFIVLLAIPNSMHSMSQISVLSRLRNLLSKSEQWPHRISYMVFQEVVNVSVISVMA